jgi:hypothetical protein
MLRTKVELAHSTKSQLLKEKIRGAELAALVG